LAFAIAGVEEEGTTNVDDCEDRHDDCAGWAKSGECASNAEWMKFYCAKSCHVCTTAETPKDFLRELLTYQPTACEILLCLAAGLKTQTNDQEECLALKEQGGPCTWIADKGEAGECSVSVDFPAAQAAEARACMESYGLISKDDPTPLSDRAGRVDREENDPSECERLLCLAAGMKTQTKNAAECIAYMDGGAPCVWAKYKQECHIKLEHENQQQRACAELYDMAFQPPPVPVGPNDERPVPFVKVKNFLKDIQTARGGSPPSCEVLLCLAAGKTTQTNDAKEGAAHADAGGPCSWNAEKGECSFEIGTLSSMGAAWRDRAEKCAMAIGRQLPPMPPANKREEL